MLTTLARENTQIPMSNMNGIQAIEEFMKILKRDLILHRSQSLINMHKPLFQMQVLEILELFIHYTPGILVIEDITTMKDNSTMLKSHHLLELNFLTLEKEILVKHILLMLGTQEIDDTMTSRVSLITLKEKLNNNMLRDIEPTLKILIFKLNK